MNETFFAPVIFSMWCLCVFCFIFAVFFHFSFESNDFHTFYANSFHVYHQFWCQTYVGLGFKVEWTTKKHTHRHSHNYVKLESSYEIAKKRIDQLFLLQFDLVWNGNSLLKCKAMGKKEIEWKERRKEGESEITRVT